MKHITISLSLLLFSICAASQTGPEEIKLLYSTNHDEGIFVNQYFRFTDSKATYIVYAGEITSKSLSNIHALIILGPKKPLSENEKDYIIHFLNKGGSLLLGLDQESRTPLSNYNDILMPYGISLTEDIPYFHNCGAIAIHNTVFSEEWEIPYSGGRSVKGGIPLAKVFMEGEYYQSSFLHTKSNGKIIVMAELMPAILLGEKDGVRLTGTVPGDTRYWGKDSHHYMKEILNFLIE